MALSGEAIWVLIDGTTAAMFSHIMPNTLSETVFWGGK